MAAGITPKSAGMEIEPVQLVVNWAHEKAISKRLGLPEVDYIEFKTQQEGEE